MVAAIGAALVACAPASVPEPGSRGEGEAVADSAEVVALPSRTEFVNRGLAVPVDSREDLRSRLGAPDSLAEEVVPNRHVPGVMDTIYTLYYPEVVARIHHPGGGGDLVSMVEVGSNRHLRFPILGLSVDRVDEAFGRPDEASDSSLVYYCASCVAGNDPVEIVFVDGEAKRVRFNYYVD